MTGPGNRPSLLSKLPDALVNGVATVFHLGRIGPAPGTLGALAGTVFFALALQNASPSVRFWTILFLLFAGVLFSGEAERRMGKRDPGCVIIDEFAVMPIVFLGMATPSGVWANLAMLAAGFGLFRVFDIAKPFGIDRIQDLPGGIGIMADDVVAALYSCAVLHILAATVGLFL
jgi:phosphatidylglycerophosphatase A